jgi:uncharacterized protein YegJ (DUF2314 family)
MSRCKACDKVLKTKEFVWREDISDWEDLCGKCKSISFTLLREMTMNMTFVKEEGEVPTVED